MDLLKRFAQGELRLARIEAFSDGVFAIVVTLGSPASSRTRLAGILPAAQKIAGLAARQPSQARCLTSGLLVLNQYR